MTAIIVYDEKIANERSWYIGKYLENFEKRGWSAELVCTNEIEEYISGNKVDAAVVRVIDPSLSSWLEDKGVRVFNSSRVSRIANDKLETYRFVAQATNVPFPDIYEYGEVMEYPLIAKKRDGHGGTQVYFFESKSELESAITESDRAGYVYQKPCTCPGRDVRVYVVGGEIIAAMERRNPAFSDAAAGYAQKFRSNFCLGGEAAVYPIAEDVKMLHYVKEITAALRLDHAGIDFIFEKDGPVFNEIEDVVGSRMLYAKTDIDIVDLYVNYIVAAFN